LRLKTKRKTQNLLDCINESVYNFIREREREKKKQRSFPDNRTTA